MSTKAIVLDIDGTLLNDQKQISKKTKEVLIEVQKKGIKLILASGRPTSGMAKFINELEMDKHHGLLVSYNGASVVDCHTQTELFNQSLTIEEGKAVLEHMKNFDIQAMIDKDDYMYVNDVYKGMITYQGLEINIIEYESRGGGYQLCEKKDLADFLDFRLNKILTLGDPTYLSEHYLQMMEPFQNTLTCMFTADFYFEFTAKGIDKAAALDAVLSPMEIHAEHVIAFGDGPNDVSMLRYAGIGVAMENAVPELKEVAQEITLSNNEDGIAHMLQELSEKQKVL